MSTAIYYSTHNNMHTNDDITNGSGSTTSGNPGANPSNPNHTNAGATINNNTNIGLNSANKNHTTLLPSLAHIMPSNSNNTTNSGSSIDISSTLINPYSSGAAAAAAAVGGGNGGYYHPPPPHSQQQQQQFDTSYSNQTTPTSAYTNFNNDSTHSPTDILMQQNMNNLASSSGNMSIGGGIDGNFSHNDNHNNNHHNNNINKCICKSKVNKIPRPRNAFILFRQKYHQMVLDEGTVIRTNPEVSRELGRRWRGLSPQEKEHWNNLAEEEKKNHAKKYPGYRYTPRRNGRNKNCPVCKNKPLPNNKSNSISGMSGSGGGGGGSISGASSLSGGLTSRDNSITNANAIDYQQQQLQQQQQQQQQQAIQFQSLPPDQYQQLIKQQQQQLQLQAQLNGGGGGGGITSNPQTIPQYITNGNYPSYIISPNPYSTTSTTAPTTTTTTTTNASSIGLSVPPTATTTSTSSQPTSANSQLHFYEAEKLSPVSSTHHQSSISEIAAQQQQQQQQQFMYNTNYSTIPPNNTTTMQQHSAGTGNDYSLNGNNSGNTGYDNRYGYGQPMIITGQSQQGLQVQQQGQHYNSGLHAAQHYQQQQQHHHQQQPPQ